MGPLQITDHPSINHPPYFLESAFTPAGDAIVYTSYRTGTPQLWMVGFPQGEHKQLTRAEAIHPYSAAIRGDRVFFVRGESICEFNIETGHERTILSVPGASLGEVSPDATGDWLVVAAKIGTQHGLLCGRANRSQWRLIPFERTVIHPQFHPLEPSWIEFAGDPAPRMHRVKRDGTGLECLYAHDNAEFVVHETFLGHTGDLVFTIWPRLLCRMDWTTRAISTIAEFNAWHITPNRAGTQILCDTNHPDTGLWMIDVASGQGRHICNTESSNRGKQWAESTYALPADFAAAQANNLSWMETPADTVYGPQYTHPHPAFSHDERHITFTSDRTGSPQIYVVTA